MRGGARRRPRPPRRCRRCPTGGWSCARCCRSARAQVAARPAGCVDARTGDGDPARRTTPGSHGRGRRRAGARRSTARAAARCCGRRRTTARGTGSPSTTRSTTCPGCRVGAERLRTAARRRTPSPAGGAMPADRPARPARGPAALRRRGWPARLVRLTRRHRRRRHAGEDPRARAAARQARAWSAQPTSRRRTSSTSTPDHSTGDSTTSRSSTGVPRRRGRLGLLVGVGAADATTRCCTAACSACRSRRALPAPTTGRTAADSSAALGLDLDDVAAAFAAPGLGLDAGSAQSGRTADRRVHRRPARAASAPRRRRDLEEREHATGFWSLRRRAGSPGCATTGCAPRTRCRSARPTVGRKGRGAAAATTGAPSVDADRRWAGPDDHLRVTSTEPSALAGVRRMRALADRAEVGRRDRGAATAESRARSTKPAPRLLPSGSRRCVGVRGVKPQPPPPRRRAVRRPGRLRCRWPGEVRDRASTACVDRARRSCRRSATGAIPDEVLLVVREAVAARPLLGPVAGRRRRRPTAPSAGSRRPASRAEHGPPLRRARRPTTAAGARGLRRAIRRRAAGRDVLGRACRAQSVDSATQVAGELAQLLARRRHRRRARSR